MVAPPLRFQDVVSQGLLAWAADVPHQADKAEQVDQVVADVDLPPEESLAGGALIVVVIVVPALAEGEDRHQPVIAALVSRLVAARADQGLRENLLAGDAALSALCGRGSAG